MNSDEISFLTPGDIQKLLTMPDCIQAVEHAFRMYGEGKAMPPVVLGLHSRAGGFHIKAGMLDSQRSYFAAKVNGNFPENPSRFGIPTIQGLIVLFDAESGTPLAFMDSRDITSLRTAAATAIAAKHLARPESKTVNICGCGNQGRVQLSALLQVYSLRTVFAYDTNQDQVLRFIKTFQSDFHVSVTQASDLPAAIRQSDICVTCTPSHRPIFDVEAVREGTFIAAIGADNSSKQELPAELMAKGKVVCDVLEQCMVMGDLHHAIEAGVMKQSDVHAELGEVVAGIKPGRQSEEEITIFDSTGMALQDVAAAALVFEKAQQFGAGTSLKLAA